MSSFSGHSHCMFFLRVYLIGYNLSIRNIVLFSPDDEMIQDIKDRTKIVLDAYQFDPVFYDITKTGRRIWISIYFTTKVDTMSFTEISLVNKQLLDALKPTYEDCFVELIPNVLVNSMIKNI